MLTFPCAGCKLLEPDDEADAGDAGGAGNEDGDTAQIADPLTREGGAVVGVVEGTTGVPIAGVQVTSGALRTVTDSQGRYALSAVSPTKAMVIRYGGDGYSHTFRSIEVVEGVVTTADAVLLTEPSPHRIEKAEEGGTLVEGGITLTIPPDAIVDALGEQVTGPIDVTITPIDPSTPQMAAAPSDFKATAIDGTADVLISYMMAQITVRRGTAELNVAPGKFVGIEMVLPLVFTESADGEPVAGFNEQERLRAGDRVPLWWMNPERGIWEEQGEGEIRPSTLDDRRLSYFADLPHFSCWNCDTHSGIPACITGFVEDCFGNPVPDAEVTANGISYCSKTISHTTPSGIFKLGPVPATNHVRLDAKALIGGVRVSGKVASAQVPNIKSNCWDTGPVWTCDYSACGRVPSIRVPLPAITARLIVTEAKDLVSGGVDKNIWARFSVVPNDPPAASCDGIPQREGECSFDVRMLDRDERYESRYVGEVIQLSGHGGEDIVVGADDAGGEFTYPKMVTAERLDQDFDLVVHGDYKDIRGFEVVRAVKMPPRLTVPQLADHGGVLAADRGAGVIIRWPAGDDPGTRVYVEVVAGEQRLSCAVERDGELEIPAALLGQLPEGRASLEVKRVKTRFFPGSGGTIGAGYGISMVRGVLDLR